LARSPPHRPCPPESKICLTGAFWPLCSSCLPAEEENESTGRETALAVIPAAICRYGPRHLGRARAASKLILAHCPITSLRNTRLANDSSCHPPVPASLPFPFALRRRPSRLHSWGAVPSFPTGPYRKRGSSEMGDPTGLLTSMQMAMNAAISGSTFTDPEVCFVTRVAGTADCLVRSLDCLLGPGLLRSAAATRRSSTARELRKLAAIIAAVGAGQYHRMEGLTVTTTWIDAACLEEP
jgi:hypothetical protein